MSTAIKTLTDQLTFTQSQNVSLSNAVDSLSAKLADAYDLLRPHEPAYVAAKLGEEMPAQTPAFTGNRKERRAAKPKQTGAIGGRSADDT